MNIPTNCEAIRACRFTGTTSAQATGYMQANLVVLPAQHAEDFERFCTRNPRPCPLLGVSEPGDPRLPTLGPDIDIATDLPSYRIWRDGEITADVTDVQGKWQAYFFAFMLGCSFGFETAFLESGIHLSHAKAGTYVAM